MKKFNNIDNLDEVVKLCRTCAKATEISVTGDYLCKKFGVVKNDYVCSKYKLNEFLPRPQKRRTLDVSQFDAGEFQI